MIWFYRLQQRLAITRVEGVAVLTLTSLFLLGLGARYLQSRPQPLPEEVYAEADRLFQEGTTAGGTLSDPSPSFDAGPAAAADTLAPAPPVQASAATIPRLDLNKATAAELDRLPRIGPKIAGRIVAYREAYGAFRRVEDLVQVRGIGEKTLARLEPHLFVETEP